MPYTDQTEYVRRIVQGTLSAPVVVDPAGTQSRVAWITMANPGASAQTYQVNTGDGLTRLLTVRFSGPRTITLRIPFFSANGIEIDASGAVQRFAMGLFDN